jgi:hypothetical protein
LAELISLEPEFKQTYGLRGLAYYELGELEERAPHARSRRITG